MQGLGTFSCVHEKLQELGIASFQKMGGTLGILKVKGGSSGISEMFEGYFSYLNLFGG